MEFTAATRAQISGHAVVDGRDPTDATLEVLVDGTWYECVWDAPALLRQTSRGEVWRRSATTEDFFAGPDVDAGDLDGATVLTLGDYDTQTRTSWPDGTTVVRASSTIQVIPV